MIAVHSPALMFTREKGQQVSAKDMFVHLVEAIALLLLWGRMAVTFGNIKFCRNGNTKRVTPVDHRNYTNISFVPKVDGPGRQDIEKNAEEVPVVRQKVRVLF